ncbi:MAG TPA: hypothetical protein VFV38_11875 [Ktedonobacteraceae bacterium]|nr:hypothetical protein [Ktedonobacteraceae bacterium]
MLHPVFDRFTTVTLIHPFKDRPSVEDIVFRLFGLYPIAQLCVADPDSRKAPTHTPDKRPAWRRGRRGLFGWLDSARITELQRVAALLRRKPRKAEAEISVLAKLEAIIEAAQTRASHLDAATVTTV